MLTCRAARCTNDIDHRADPRRIYCSRTCLMRAFRARDRERRAQVERALQFFTASAAARHNGDTAAADRLEGQALDLVIAASLRFRETATH